MQIIKCMFIIVVNKIILVNKIIRSHSQIERIINTKVWERYVYRRKEVSECNGGNPNERVLFHGEWNRSGRGHVVYRLIAR